MDKSKYNVEEFHDYGIHTQSRTVFMLDTSDVETTRIIKNLHILDATEGSITIKMNNDGGDYLTGMAVYDAIKACNNHVSILAYGYVMSMGSVILQAADASYLSPNSSFMLHYGAIEVEDHVKNVEAWVELSKRQTESMLDIYMASIRRKHPKYKRSDLKKMMTYDKYLTAAEAVELGLADGVK